MATCQYCGRAIVFRYVGGQRTPIHLDGGGWCSGDRSRNDSYRRPTLRVYEHEHACWPTRCPKCQASVFFVRHNGGSVWLDDLGPPWPKHPCFDHPAGDHHATDRVIRSFRSLAPDDDGEYDDASLGLVSRICMEADGGTAYTLLAVSCGKDTQVCVSMKGRFDGLLGQLVLLKLTPDGQGLEKLFAEDGTERPLLNPHVAPDLLGLPADWPRIRGKPVVLPKPASRPAVSDNAMFVTKPRPAGKKVVKLPPTSSKKLVPKRPLTRCPHCGQLVRQTRFQKHVRTVHPSKWPRT